MGRARRSWSFSKTRSSWSLTLFWLDLHRRSPSGNAAGRKCLELGCGSGVVGVALSRAGAARILLTDGNSDAVQNCEHNMRLNDCKTTNETNSRFGFGPQVSVCSCTWGCVPTIKLGCGSQSDKTSTPHCRSVCARSHAH